MSVPTCIQWAADRNYNVCSKADITHNAMDGRTSSLKIPDSEVDEWLDLMAADLTNNHKLYFSENANIEQCKVFFDIDLKRRDLRQEEFENDFLLPVIAIINGVIRDCYGYLQNDELLRMVICVRALKDPLIENAPISAGAHVYCPYITASRAILAKLRSVSLLYLSIPKC